MIDVCLTERCMTAVKKCYLLTCKPPGLNEGQKPILTSNLHPDSNLLRSAKLHQYLTPHINALIYAPQIILFAHGDYFTA